MGGRFTEIPPETFEQIVVDAGVLLRRFDLFDPDYDITPDIITATTGGVELSAEMEITDLGEDVDNCANDTMELARLTSWNCRIASTAVGSSPEIMQMILGAADLSGDIDVIPRAVLNLSDFKDLWWVGDRVDGGLLAVHIANALSISGLSLQTSKAQKGQFDFEIQAHMSIYDLDRIPMTFYVMAPGAWEITGITVGDVYVEKGVPTQVPVKFVMGDGSIMDPSDYGHNFTYSATLPAGGTMTADGIITLTGKNDTVDVTVTYTKGDTVLTDEGTVKVMDAHVVQILITEKPIHMEGNSSRGIPLLIRMSDGEEIVPTDRKTGFTYRIEGFPEDVTINENGILVSKETSGTGVVHVTYTLAGRTVTDSVHVDVEYIPPPYLPYSIELKFLNSYNGGSISLTASSNESGGQFIDWGNGETTPAAGVSSRVFSKYVSKLDPSKPWNGKIALRGGKQADGTYGYMFLSYDGTKANTYKEKVEHITWDDGGDGPNSSLAGFTSLKTYTMGATTDRLQSSVVRNHPSLEGLYIYCPDTFRFDSFPFNRATKLKEIVVMAKEITFDTSNPGYVTGWFQYLSSLEVWDISHVTSVPVLTATHILKSFPSRAKIHVPAALLEDFKTATNWSVVANQFVGV